MPDERGRRPRRRPGRGASARAIGHLPAALPGLLRGAPGLDDGENPGRGAIVAALADLCEAGLELALEGRHGREPPGGILGERLVDRRLDAPGDVGPLEADGRRGGVDVLHRDGDEVVAGERHLAGEELEEHDAERVDVGLGVDVAALRLLGRDVVAGSEHGAGRGLLRGRLHRARDPEVGHLRLALAVQEDVLRLDVAVDEPVLVREREAARDLDRELERTVDGQRAVSDDHLLQVVAGDVLEDDVGAAVGLAAVDHGDDVRVREPGDELCLAGEAVDDVLVRRQPLVEHLERDGSLEHAIVGPEDARHASGADELLELVAIRDDVAGHHVGST